MLDGVIETHTVLAIDGDEKVLEQYRSFLGNKYQVLAYQSGQQALQKLAQHKPRHILLDTELKDIDSYQLFDSIRHNNDTAHIPITFVSSHDDMQERQKGFELGANDYLVKPLVRDELIAKIDFSMKLNAENEELKQELKNANQMTFDVMMASGELGVVIHTLRSISECQEPECIINELDRALSKYHLSYSLHIRLPHATFFHNSSGKPNHIEEAILSELPGQDRIFDFSKNRTIINHSNISILIRNMPIDDPNLYGRIKDNLALLTEGVASRLNSIAMEREIKKKNQFFNQIHSLIQNYVNNITLKNEEYHQQGLDIFDKSYEKTMESFNHLNLTEDQEEYILQIMKRSMGDAMQLYDSLWKNNQQLASIVDLIKLANQPDDELSQG